MLRRLVCSFGRGSAEGCCCSKIVSVGPIGSKSDSSNERAPAVAAEALGNKGAVVVSELDL